MFKYTPQDNIITEFIKNDPVQKFTHPWILILCLISLDDPHFVIVESLVWAVKLPAVLQKNPQLLHNLWFSNIFCIFVPFPKVTLWFEIHIFTLRDSYTTITKGGHIYWCSRRQRNAFCKGCVNLWAQLYMHIPVLLHLVVCRPAETERQRC